MRVGDLRQNDTIGDETLSNFYATLWVDALCKWILVWCESLNSRAHMIHLMMRLVTGVVLGFWQETKGTVACQPPAVKSLSIWTAFMRSHWQNTWPEGKMKTNNQYALYRCTLNETQAHLMFFLRLYDCTNTQQIHIIDLLSQKKSIIGS